MHDIYKITFITYSDLLILCTDLPPEGWAFADFLCSRSVYTIVWTYDWGCGGIQPLNSAYLAAYFMVSLIAYLAQG